MQHALDVPTRFALPAQEVQDVPDHPLTDIDIARICLAFGQLGKPFGNCQSGPQLAPVEKACPQTPQSPKLVIDILPLFR